MSDARKNLVYEKKTVYEKACSKGRESISRLKLKS